MAWLGARYRLLVFLSSFLLFQVQLIVARMLLPYFGSSAAVWTTALMFFQGALFLGYLYGAQASRWIHRGRYGWVHVGWVALPAVIFPFRFFSFELHPILAVTLALAISVGWPFIALSTTSVVAQGWLTRTAHPGRKDPYFLYGVSNAGALLALLTYPFLVEPALDTGTQLWLWYGGYALFVALVASCVPRRTAAAPQAVSEQGDPGRPAGPGQRALWLMLPLAANAVLMASTTALTLDAPVPLLWIVPLTVYLLTLVICFARTPPSRRTVQIASGLALGVAAAAAVAIKAQQHLQLAWILLHTAVVFVGALLLHWNLVRVRPQDTRQLGSYYLHLSLGGWLGAVLISVVVPLVFRRLALEYLDYAVAGACTLAALLVRDRQLLAGWVRARPLAAVVVGVGSAALLVGLSALVLAAEQDRRLDSSRTFYGFYNVKDAAGLRWFHHGNTIHGKERVEAERKGEPLAYFHPESPVARALQLPLPRREVAVVGLGVGTLAAYALPGERWDFYELDAEVERIARAHFTYLAGAQAEVRVVLGDARLKLASFAEDGRYDVLVLDAFSSDYIPVHLVTREALELYHRKLRPGGLLLVHISNRIFDLGPVLTRTSAPGGWHAFDSGVSLVTHEQSLQGWDGSRWFALTTSADAGKLLEQTGWSPSRSKRGLADQRPWTDDYVNLLGAIRW
jgi:SAM-dependent methyltransferase